jgi:hypothetical protein
MQSRPIWARRQHQTAIRPATHDHNASDGRAIQYLSADITIRLTSERLAGLISYYGKGLIRGSIFWFWLWFSSFAARREIVGCSHSRAWRIPRAQHGQGGGHHLGRACEGDSYKESKREEKVEEKVKE